MERNLLSKLAGIGESIWLDNLTRNLMNSGELKRLIEVDGVSGITSNPTIFQKAISGSKDYDPSLESLIQKGIRDAKELFLGLAFEDIARAADFLSPVYQASGGRDGFVSMEVSPDLAYNTEETIAEAKRLFTTLGKKNILIKVPGTKQGLPAIEELTAQGVNVNVTLLFSVNRYQEVAEAYIRGLEKRVRLGLPLMEITSVASFFVSRVDTLVDKLLEARLPSAASDAEIQKIKILFGKAAAANAKIAYKKYQEIFSGKRFRSLEKAQVQKILWGSTGTKNPRYSDVKYFEELIAPDSINTLPESTLKAVKDHGKFHVPIGENIAEAETLFSELRSVGVDIHQVTQQLEAEGVKLFADSFSALLQEIARKRDSFLSRRG